MENFANTMQIVIQTPSPEKINWEKEKKNNYSHIFLVFFFSLKVSKGI